MSYRPITDVWILARPKVAYYGAYPAGFLQRARDLLGVTAGTRVLHVCSGKVKDYPYSGFGEFDQTVDIDKKLKPDFVMDVRKELPMMNGKLEWPAILADPPYTEEDATQYKCGSEVFPNANKLLKDCLSVVRVGGRVGMLHYVWPHPPKSARSVAAVGVLVGFNNRIRIFSVFERIC